MPRIKENELNTEIAVEAKKRQIREAKVEADLSVEAKEQQVRTAKLSGQIDLESERARLVQAHVANARAEARLNDGQVLRAFNDLFVGVRSHISARYHLHFQDQEEDQSSSGIIISTGAGATGWLSSLFNMADRMIAAFGSSSEGLPRPDMAWDSDRLVFVVREPFISKTSTAAVTCGLITPEAPLLLESHMPEQGLIFSDGVESDFLAFNAGCAATIGLAAQQTRLVVG